MVVKCPDDEFTIIVSPEVWDNINYSVNSTTKAITENKIGSYTQIPLRLAWSITIHKSQGLTFEKAIIDAEGAFVHGQTYVALSRCKSLKGLVLKSKIDSRHIISDTNVLSFNEEAEENQPDTLILNHSKATFQLNLITDIFDFYKLLYPVNRVLDIFYNNRNRIEGHIEEPLLGIKEGVTKVLKVANAFKAQLQELCSDGQLPEQTEDIQLRFTKAINYFNEQLESGICQPYKGFNFTTDNKTIENDLIKALDVFEELLATKQLYFKTLSDGFKVNAFLELRAKSVFLTKERPKPSRKTVIDGTSNIELFELLRELRNAIATDKDLIHYQIFSQKSLYEMCEKLPTNKGDLLQINGFGKTRIAKYGSEILEVIRGYCDKNSIETSSDVDMFEALKPKRRKGNTKRTSLDLFKSGKGVEQIALERELKVSTITGHLASFIPTKEVSILDLMSERHYTELKAIIPQKKFDTISDLKQQLDDKYTFQELRLVLDDLSNSAS